MMLMRISFPNHVRVGVGKKAGERARAQQKEEGNAPRPTHLAARGR